MASPEESAKRSIMTGWAWALASIAMSLGEEIAPSPQVIEAAREARRAIHAAQQAYRRFRVLAGHDEDDGDGRQQRLPNTGADAAKPVVVRDDEDELVVGEAGEDDGRQRIDDAQQALDGQLGELGIGEDQIEATVDLVEGELRATISWDGDEDGDVGTAITRELDRVMAALQGLAPGCGPTAARAALCGLEETPARPEGCKGDGNCPNCLVPFEECNGDAGALGAQRREVYGPTPADVVGELRRLKFDASVANYDAIADCVLVYWKLEGEDGENVAIDLWNGLAALKGLPDGTSELRVLDVLRGLEKRGAEAGDDQVEDDNASELEHADRMAAEQLERADDGVGAGPHGAAYVDDQGHEVGVYAGLDRSSWGSMWRSEGGGLHRVKSSRVPMRATPEEAQADLDAYAPDRGWKRVGEGSARSPVLDQAQLEHELSRVGAIDIRVSEVWTNNLGTWARVCRHTQAIQTLTTKELLNVLAQLADHEPSTERGKAVWKELQGAARAKASAPAVGPKRYVNVDKEDIGEQPAKRKRGAKAKPRQVELSGPPEGYDEAKFVGD